MEKAQNLMLQQPPPPQRPSSIAIPSYSPAPASASPIQRPQMDLPGHHSSYFATVQLHPLPPRQGQPNTAGGSPPDAAGKRLGIPPLSPHFPLYPPPPPATAGAAARSPSSSAASPPPPFHSRSLSQPPFCSLDNLPTLTLPPTAPADAPTDAASAAPLAVPRTPTGRAPGDGLPPRKAHRRSQSDIPTSGGVFLPPPPSPVMAATPPLPQRARQLVKQEEKELERGGGTEATGEGNSDGEDGDDLINAFMNLDGLESLNSSGAEEKQENSSRMSGTRSSNGADSSENEAESSSAIGGGASVDGEMKRGNKRLAAGEPMSSRHTRSLSMDSLMSKLHFGDESPKFPPFPRQHSCSGSMEGMMDAFSPGLRNGEFSSAEMKKIMANEKLAQLASTDPKKVKRILANRQSAARSKERKMRYISELEHKVQTLQTEATTLSAQLTLLQRDSAGLTSQNNELKFRIKSMEQQAQLRDALNHALTAEVQRLKLATGEIRETKLANSSIQQMPMNARVFQSHQVHFQSQQSSEFPVYQTQPPDLQQQQHSSADVKPDPNQC